MKKLNLFSDLCSSVVGSRKDNGSTRLRVDYDSFTCRLRVWPLKLVSVLVLVLSLGIGNVWGVSVAYDFSVAANNPGNGNNWFSDDIGAYASWSATTGSNDPKYYDIGSGLRIYNGGKFTITSIINMSSITLTFSSTDYTFSTGNTTTPQTVTLSPAAKSYEWSVSRTCRLQKVEITYASGGCDAIDVTGGSAITLPAGSTTYNTSDWLKAGAAYAYPASVTTYSIGDDAYCVSLTNVADFKDATGIRFKASSGVLQISDIVSNYGIDVEFGCAGTNGFKVELTGASDKNGQTGTVTMSTTSTTATLKISKNTSNQGNVTYIKITPKAAPTCFNAVTLAHNSPSHGSVSFSNDGPIETCDEGVDVTMTITPASGYRLSAYDVGAGSVSTASGSGAITVPSNTTQNVTLKFAQNANGTYTANATFEAKPLNSISLSAASGEVYVGQYAQFAITYDPADILTKGTTLDGTPSYCVTTGTTNTTLKITGGKAGASITENKTETVTIKANADNTKKASVTMTIKPLPYVSFVDIVHDKTDFTGLTDGKVTATLSANALVPSKPVPTHADVSAPVGGNACETQHLHLIGWIYSEWSGVANYLSGTADAPNTSAITEATVGTEEGFPASTPCYFAVGSNINTSTWNGKTFYAVWAKEVMP